jgi:fermentation-respiration switch protein FrsA (DUF1100 family)|tara:strand:- start:1742 stop:2551 length:810 start_codon:yes stop_codon:yes gene_type:complete
MAKLFYISLLLGLVIYFVVLTYIYLFQRDLLYHPSVNSYQDDKVSFDYEEVFIKNNEGIKLKGWLHKKDLINKKTILFFHGNAGNLSNRNYKLNELSKLDLNFLIVAWRGFSGNLGDPTEKALYQDARNSLNWLEKKGVKQKNLILYGESLGTAIAVEVAQNKNLAGVILESPFTSMVELSQQYYPLLPVKFLLKDKYETIKKIRNVNSPLLVLHGKLDNIVPFSMGERLFNKANEPKFKYFVQNDDHMMRYDQKLLDEITKFISYINK